MPFREHGHVVIRGKTVAVKPFGENQIALRKNGVRDVYYNIFACVQAAAIYRKADYFGSVLGRGIFKPDGVVAGQQVQSVSGIKFFKNVRVDVIFTPDKQGSSG